MQVSACAVQPRATLSTKASTIADMCGRAASAACVIAHTSFVRQRPQQRPRAALRRRSLDALIERREPIAGRSPGSSDLAARLPVRSGRQWLDGATRTDLPLRGQPRVGAKQRFARHRVPVSPIARNSRRTPAEAAILAHRRCRGDYARHTGPASGIDPEQVRRLL